MHLNKRLSSYTKKMTGSGILGGAFDGFTGFCLQDANRLIILRGLTTWCILKHVVNGRSVPRGKFLLTLESRHLLATQCNKKPYKPPLLSDRTNRKPLAYRQPPATPSHTPPALQRPPPQPPHLLPPAFRK
jgi:hypothetical protein